MPALLVGAQVAGIVFFLNPELPWSPSPFLRATLYFALLALPLSILAHLYLARWLEMEPLRLLPWSISAVAAIGALGFGVHASHFAFLLPEAMNRQLIKAALWMGLAAVLVFYTALLHGTRHRRYGWRSRAFVALAVVGGVFAVVDRRTSFRPVAAAVPPLAADAEQQAPRIVLVALPSATLDSVLPLARQGRLPFFARMLESGAAARLSGWPPPRREALLASWATGKQPFRHGVVGARRYAAPLLGRSIELSLLPLAPGFELWGLFGGSSRPIAEADLAALTVWEIFARLNRDATATGFPAWMGGAPYPAALPPGGGSLAERELQTLGKSVYAELLARDRRRFALARQRAASAPVASLSAFSFDGVEQVSLGLYGGFSAARFGGARAGVLTRAADAYEAYLGGLDDELARLWEETPPPRLLAVSSAFGVVAPEGVERMLRSLVSREQEVGGALAGSPAGLLLLAGDDLQPPGPIAEARTVDLVPTLLYAAGAPIARDFDGRVLTELFTPALLQRRALSFVPSFEGLPKLAP